MNNTITIFRSSTKSGLTKQHRWVRWLSAALLLSVFAALCLMGKALLDGEFHSVASMQAYLCRFGMFAPLMLKRREYVLLFCVLYSASSWLISNHFERSSLEEAHIRRLGAELQQFIEEKELSSQDLKKLETWERRNPVILLEVYVDGACLYSSMDAVYDHGTLPGDVGSLNQAVTVRLTDTEATAMLFSDYTYQYYLLGTVLSWAWSRLSPLP